MYDGEIIDSHMHLWDLKNNYAWLSENVLEFEQMVGDYSQIRKNFLITDYLSMVKASNVVGSVHIEAFGFPEDPVLEVRWLQDIADRYDFPQGIIGLAKLDVPDIEKILQRHQKYANFKGIRMPLNWHDEKPYMSMCDRPDYMQDEMWLHGFSLLQKYQLVFDMSVYDHQLSEVEILAKIFPNTQIIINHLAWPTDFSAEGFSLWQQRLQGIAACDNVNIKLSCIGCAFQGHISEELIIAYIKGAINHFGTQRCLFGSNFPPDSLFYTWNDLLDLIKRAVGYLSYADQKQLFYENAKHIYQL